MGANCAASEYPPLLRLDCSRTSCKCKEDPCASHSYSPDGVAPEGKDAAMKLLVAHLEVLAEDRCFSLSDAQADLVVVSPASVIPGRAATRAEKSKTGAFYFWSSLLESLSAAPRGALLACVAAMAGAAATKELSLACSALSTAISESAADIASLGPHDFEDQYFPFLMTAAPLDILAATIRFLFDHVCVNAKALLGCKVFPVFSTGATDLTDRLMLDAAQIEDVAVFVYQILESGRFAKAELIVGTMYLLRFLDKAGVLMHPTNWRQLFCCALSLADAYLEDKAISRYDLVNILRSQNLFVSCSQILDMQLVMLLQLDFNLFFNENEFHALVERLLCVARGYSVPSCLA